MENRTIRTNRLRLARVKYFDWREKGVELTNVEAYAFLMKVGDKYINIFDPLEDLAVYDRSLYTNEKNGIEFGNRLIHLSGRLENGPCYVIESVKVDTLIGSPVIHVNDLKNYIYNSENFFVDRLHLLEEEPPMKRFKMRYVMQSDQEKMKTLKAYIDSHQGSRQYYK